MHTTATLADELHREFALRPAQIAELLADLPDDEELTQDDVDEVFAAVGTPDWESMR